MNYLWLYGAIVWLTLGYGCAQQELPVCEKYQYHTTVDMNGRTYVVLDIPNAKKLAQLVVGLANGTCRLAAPTGPSTGV
jgi:hypothetical protein